MEFINTLNYFQNGQPFSIELRIDQGLNLLGKNIIWHTEQDAIINGHLVEDYCKLVEYFLGHLRNYNSKEMTPRLIEISIDCFFKHGCMILPTKQLEKGPILLAKIKDKQGANYYSVDKTHLNSGKIAFTVHNILENKQQVVLEGGFDFWKSENPCSLQANERQEDSETFQLNHVVYQGPIGYNKHITVYKYAGYCLITEIILIPEEKFSKGAFKTTYKWSKRCDYIKISDKNFEVTHVIFQKNNLKLMAIFSINPYSGMEMVCILNKESNKVTKCEIPKVSKIREPYSEIIDQNGNIYYVVLSRQTKAHPRIFKSTKSEKQGIYKMNKSKNQHKLAYHDLKHQLRKNKRGLWNLDIVEIQSEVLLIDFRENKIYGKETLQDLKAGVDKSYEMVVTKPCNISRSLKSIQYGISSSSHIFFLDWCKVELMKSRIRLTINPHYSRYLKMKFFEIQYNSEKFIEVAPRFNFQHFYEPTFYNTQNYSYMFFLRRKWIPLKQQNAKPYCFMIVLNKEKMVQGTSNKSQFYQISSLNIIFQPNTNTSINKIRKNIKSEEWEELTETEKFSIFCQNFICFNGLCYELSEESLNFGENNRIEYFYHYKLVDVCHHGQVLESINFKAHILSTLNKTFERIENKKNFLDMVEQLLRLGPEILNLLETKLHLRSILMKFDEEHMLIRLITAITGIPLTNN